MIRLAGTITALALLALHGCAARHGARTAGKGNLDVSASVGGPVFHDMGAPIPLPLAHFGAYYGVTEKVDGGGGLHATAAAYGTIGADLGVRYQLWKRADGAAIATSALVNIFAGTRELELRAFPELGVHGQWPLGRRYLALGGIDTLMQLDPPAGKPPILAAPYLGLELGLTNSRARANDSAPELELGLTNSRARANDSAPELDRHARSASAISITLGWISPWQDSTSVIDYAPATMGAFAIHLGYRRHFGRVR